MDYNSKIVMLKGADGAGITDIKKTSTSGLTDTYTITLADGQKHNFDITNGKGISSISKTGTNGLVDTYTITYNDGTTQNYTLNNGKGISSISKTGTSGLVDTYTITYNDGTTSTFTVENGEGLQNLQVGGRNLLKYSKGEIVLRNSTFNEVTKEYLITNEEGLIGDNTTVTISADIKTNGHVKDMEFMLFDNNVKNIPSKKFDNLPTTYTRMSATITTQPHQTGEDWSTAHIRFDNNATDSEGTEALLYIRNPKVEIGNIATGWTPAPEDLTDTSITNSDIDTILNS